MYTWLNGPWTNMKLVLILLYNNIVVICSREASTQVWWAKWWREHWENIALKLHILNKPTFQQTLTYLIYRAANLICVWDIYFTGISLAVDCTFYSCSWLHTWYVSYVLDVTIITMIQEVQCLIILSTCSSRKRTSIISDQNCDSNIHLPHSHASLPCFYPPVCIYSNTW